MKQLKKNPQCNSINKIILFLIITILVPATILFGYYFLNDRKYYFISLLILLYAIVPFLMLFEKRKPMAREIIIIAVLTAIAVAGRMAFFMVPQFKPVIAIVIISSVCLGAETGFLVGALSGFVSNMFFGQGPWTPWQIFAYGIIGYIAGLLFTNKRIRKSRLYLCIYGGLATYFIYGGIVNVGSLLMLTPIIMWQTLLATYIAGFWFDIIHTVATIFFLYIISQPMIEKIERVIVKYGLTIGKKI